MIEYNTAAGVYNQAGAGYVPIGDLVTSMLLFDAVEHVKVTVKPHAPTRP